MPRRPRPGVTVTHKPVPRPTGQPTPEHAAQREAMAEGGDAAMTTIPIDVALLRGRLTREQHAAAKRYWFLWHAVVQQSPNLQAVNLYTQEVIDGESAPAEPDPDAEQRFYDELAGAMKAIRKAHGAGSLSLIENMVIYEHWPSWCWASNKAPLSVSQIKAMEVARKALDSLDAYFSTLYGRSSGKVRHTIMDESEYMQS